MIDPDGSRWDVDNDGDGVADSVWVDLGMPVRQTADGRLYKPLLAILCVDLDGRLNLNAHGSLPQTDTAHYNTMASQAGGVFNGNVTARGQGLGPADVNIAYLLDPGYPSSAIYPTVAPYSHRLMKGYTYTLGFVNYFHQGRYGTDGAASALFQADPNRLAYPGTAALIPDTLNANKWFEYGPNFWNFTNVNMSGSYGSPPDPFGVGALGLDVAGRPVYAQMYDNIAMSFLEGYGGGVTNSPYELNLDPNQTRGVPSSIATVDNPFGPAELERILRPFDRDAPSLPDRLAQLSAATPGDTTTSVLHNLRHSLTTESWDLPCPNVVTPSSLSSIELDRLAPDRRVKHITDLLRARGVPASAWAKLLPADLLAGLKMNINRPFGNGLDDDGNGVVDEQWPPEAGEQVTLFGTDWAISYDGSNTLATNSLEARQLEARFLYVLAMLVADTDAIKNRYGWTDEELARFLAQWAVNAVDFKDRDSIMTPFEYDIYPFDDNDIPLNNNPWDVDGLFGGPTPDDDQSYRGLVWGCERPDLLFSENIAFHDRRTEDTASEQHDNNDPGDTSTASGTTAAGGETDPTKQDSSYDQTYRPQGSLFVELYNPQSPMAPRSADLYDAPNGGVELTKLTPASAGNQFPVWKIVIATSAAYNSHSDPDHPQLSEQTDIEREVYFVDQNLITGTLSNPKLDISNISQRRFFPSTSSATSLTISPGRYALIGPAEEIPATYQDSHRKRTYIGYLTTGTPSTVGSTTRYIDLDSSSLPVRNNTNSKYGASLSDPDASVTGVVNQPEMLAIDYPNRLNISEPIDGLSYADMEALILGNTKDTNGKYTTTYDRPFDLKRSDADAGVFATNGTAVRHRVMFLQRLANPLLPYDANSNPYRTIDKMAVDLTVFNGIASDSNDVQIAQGTTHFESRQRGESDDGDSDGLSDNINIWRQETAVKNTWDTTSRTQNDHFFENGLKHSLGYLNQPFNTPIAHPITGELGLPSSPFSWLTWNNRPYVSPLELMQVSWLRSSKLLGTYRMALSGDDPYTVPSQPFSHLMNFFPSGPTTSPDEELHRVFEYLGVPSRFVGTETQANPTAANSAGHNFRPPFNGISAYREPGRINLNTIYSPSVFNGLKNGSLPNVTWRNFVGSRRGYPAAVGSMVLGPDNTFAYPTEFGKPFRSFGGAAMVPTLDPAHDVLKYDREIDATLLRADSSGTSPLFQYNSSNAVDNTDRNPYFRYQGIQRLGNLVTTRSNVYAVWITVGYFEVSPAIRKAGMTPLIFQQVYPDGYELGRELGMDTGEIERHRAFYIFDRSIPVGFQRGQDLNVEKAILVDRYIE
ncbi:MAG: hypothetical protein KKE86_00650 [Planctomycetes bacterium]|nr:hypothetical protein [Planctomycetota bacterium]